MLFAEYDYVLSPEEQAKHIINMGTINTDENVAYNLGEMSLIENNAYNLGEMSVTENVAYESRPQQTQ